jgi:hypothetical protein
MAASILQQAREHSESAETDLEVVKQRCVAAGHDFSGGMMCSNCEVGLRELYVGEKLGKGIPPCPNPKPDRPSGNKYHRIIYGLKAYGGGYVTIDVYSALTAFGVTVPGLQHAAKKILCAGIRGKGSRVQDLKEARDALDRAIEDCEHEGEPIDRRRGA